MLLENQFIHNFRYNLFTWRMLSNRVKTIGSRELLTNYSCEQIVTKLSILTRNWIEACLLCTGQKACPWCDTGIIGQLIIWLLYTKSTRSYSPTLFPPNVFSFSLLTYGLLIQFLPFSSQKQPPPLLSLSLRKGSYMTSLSLWAVRFFDHQESTLNPTYKVCSPFRHTFITFSDHACGAWSHSHNLTLNLLALSLIIDYDPA